jgi:hypothetical protein
VGFNLAGLKQSTLTPAFPLQIYGIEQLILQAVKKPGIASCLR